MTTKDKQDRVVSTREAYLALHADYEKALSDRERLVEALRLTLIALELDGIKADQYMTVGKSRALLRELGEE